MKLLKYNQFITESNVDKHTYHLLSYEDCRLICDTHDNFIFYESKHKEDGFDISIFNYRLATFQNFENPVPDFLCEKPVLCVIYKKLDENQENKEEKQLTYF